MFTIGQFARLGQVSLKLLRYYDRIELLKPAHTHPENGYRFYTLDQLTTLNRIIALKNLGLSLKNIQYLLETPLATQELRGMLKLKQVQLRQHLEQEQQRLHEVEARLSILENAETTTQLDVAVKTVTAQKIVSLRRRINDGEEIAPLFTELRHKVSDHIEGQVGIGIFHYDQFRDTSRQSPPLFTMADGQPLHQHELPGAKINDLEVAFTIDSHIPRIDDIRVRELPAVDEMATLILHGEYSERGIGYIAFSHWITANGYTVADSIREIYLRYEGHANHPNNLVEIQFPIQKDTKT